VKNIIKIINLEKSKDKRQMSSSFSLPHPSVVKYYSKYRKPPDQKLKVSFISPTKFEIDDRYEVIDTSKKGKN